MSNIISSPLNYTGSKHKLIPQMRNYFPQNAFSFYDVFCGGGSVFINVDFSRIYVNDIITPLIRFYQWLQTTEWNEVITEINQRNIPKDDRESYANLRNRFNITGDSVDFFILCCSCTNNMMRFNKQFKFNQTWGKRNFNNNTEKKLKAFHDKLYKNNNITFTNKQFYEETVDDYNSLVYLDPPYMITEAGYNMYWSKQHEETLYNYLDKLNDEGKKFMLSNVLEHKGVVNPYLDRLKKYNIIELEYDYNKVSRNGKSKSREILVINYV